MTIELGVSVELSDLKRVVAEQDARLAELGRLVGSPSGQRRWLWRSRWAAIGAAVAVALGGGTLAFVNAIPDTSGLPSSFVAVSPVRVVDTRTNLGFSGQFTSLTARDLQVTGFVPTVSGNQQVVTAGATGVVLNVTVVGPTAAGFLSVQPGNATAAPSTSNLNFAAGQILANAVTVFVPTTGEGVGKIKITYNAFGVAGPTTHVLVDIVGYYQPDADDSHAYIATGILVPSTPFPDPQVEGVSPEEGKNPGGFVVTCDEGDIATYGLIEERFLEGRGFSFPVSLFSSDAAVLVDLVLASDGTPIGITNRNSLMVKWGIWSGESVYGDILYQAYFHGYRATVTCLDNAPFHVSNPN